MRFVMLLAAAAVYSFQPFAIEEAYAAPSTHAPSTGAPKGYRVYQVVGSYDGALPFLITDRATLEQLTFPSSGDFAFVGPAYTGNSFNNTHVFVNGEFVRRSDLGAIGASNDLLSFKFADENPATLYGIFSFAMPEGLFAGLNDEGRAIFNLGTYDLGNGISLTISPVPEPSTWALMILGFGAVGYGMRRRSRMTVSYS